MEITAPVNWRSHLNRLNGGIACCVIGLILAVPAAAANSELVAFQTAREVMDVKVADVTIGSVYQPVTRLVFIVEIALAAFLIGLLLLVGYAIDRRAGYVP